MNFQLSSQRLLLLSRLATIPLFVIASVLLVQGQEDTTAPVLAGFGFSPQQVDTTSSTANLTFSAHVTDDISGVDQVSVYTWSPSQTIEQYYSAPSVPVTGSTLDGTFQVVVNYPRYSENGTWTVAYVTLRDKVGNYRTYHTADLQAAGFPTTFTNVLTTPYDAHIHPPINSDGSSVFSAKRGVVPVKFTVTRDEVPVCTVADATISVVRTAGSSTGAIDEGTYLGASDSGSYFRVDPTACQYIYNLSVSSFGVGAYRVNISIDGVVVGHAVFALK